MRRWLLTSKREHDRRVWMSHCVTAVRVNPIRLDALCGPLTGWTYTGPENHGDEPIRCLRCVHLLARPRSEPAFTVRLVAPGRSGESPL